MKSRVTRRGLRETENPLIYSLALLGVSDFDAT